MTTLWQPYIPYHVLDDLVKNPHDSIIGRHRVLTAVTLFADISGFTAMSEALGQSGRIGTEELTRILNRYFEPMITLIERYGGIIGKFGGDAITVLFPYASDTQAAVTRQAAACALEMQREMAHYSAIQTSAGVFTLSMKIGMAGGTVHVANVGDEASRIEFVIAGDAINACAEAEHHAEKNQVIVQDGLLSFLPQVTVMQRFEGFAQIRDFEAQVTPQPLPELAEIPASLDDALQHFVHPSIGARLKIARSDFVDEHRKVTLLFVSFTDFDFDRDPTAMTGLQGYLLNVIQIVQGYGGYVNKVDMGDKGSKYVVLFGAPISHENDEERALHCALDLRTIPGAEARIGINTGFVFAGHVGAEARREYTVMGDVVNVAARLMQRAAPGQIIVSEATHDRLPGKFLWQTLEPVTLKGKTQPIRIYGLEGVRLSENVLLREPEYSLPMVGRADILRQIETRLALARRGQGQVVVVSGEAGMGKSRLGAEVIRAALRMGMVGYGGACQSYNTNVGYVVWQNIWRGFFLLDANAPTDVQSARLREQLEALNPDFVQRMPLLGVVLNLAIPENDFTRSLEASLRQELLETLLLDLLRSARRPMLMVLEDCHWIDPQSRVLLEYLARNIAGLPVLMLIFHRPLEVTDQRLVPPSEQVLSVELPLFTDEETRRLIGLKLAQLFGRSGEAASVRMDNQTAGQMAGQSDDDAPVTIPTALADRITQIAGGNPFYIDELMNLLRDRGIDVADTDALFQVELPPSLHALIQRRVDELGEDDKTVLKVASVIGRLFRASWIPGAYPEIGSFDRVLHQLNRLESLELTPLDRLEPELEYLFKHILTQQVAYDTLSYALREDLHERVGHFIETRYSDDLNPLLFLIAFHYGNSRNHERQRFYFRLAGDHARRLFLNQAAVDYYQRLLRLLDASDPSGADAVSRGDVLYALGEVWQHTGRWDEAQTHYRQALELAGDDPVRVARCHAALGDTLSYHESHEEAIQLLEQARERFEALGDAEGLNRVLKSLGYLYIRMGDYDRAQQYAEAQLRIGQQDGDRAAQSDAAQTLGQVALFTGRNDDALRYFREAAEAAERAGYRQGVIYALGNLTGVHVNFGRYEAALESIEQALQAAQSIGYTRASAVITGNRGYVYEQVGMYDDALVWYSEGLRQTLELCDYPSIQLNVGNLAQVRQKQGAYDDAAYLYRIAAAMDRTLQMPYFLSGYLLGAAQAAAEQSRFADALSLAQQARQVAEEAGEASVAFQSDVLAAVMRVREGQLDASAGVQTLQGMRAALNGADSGELLADVLYQMWRLNPDDSTIQQEARERYQALYEAAPNAVYQSRWRELGGTDAAALPVLPVMESAVRPDAWRDLVANGLREYLEG